MMSGLGENPQIPDNPLDIQAAPIFCLLGQVLLNLICFDLASRQFAWALPHQPSENESYSTCLEWKAVLVLDNPDSTFFSPWVVLTHQFMNDLMAVSHKLTQSLVKHL